MRRNELTIVVVLAGLGAIVAFWLLVLAPKRQEASNLKGDVADLQSQVDQAQQAATVGEEAKKSFPVDYRRLVVLGKAVPADGDQASLLVQLQRLADRSDVSFRSIELTESQSSVASSTPPPSTSTDSTSDTSSTSTPTSSSSATSSSSTTSTSSTTASTPTATEASAATLPIGASIGPAGLPVMPYQMTFTGGFFEIADFLQRVNGLVSLRQDDIDVKGRLVTVDAFNLSPVETEDQNLSPVPTLTASLSVTTYLTPADQGTTAGATPTGPAPAASTPVSATSTPSSSTTTP